MSMQYWSKHFGQIPWLLSGVCLRVFQFVGVSAGRRYECGGV